MSRDRLQGRVDDALRPTGFMYEPGFIELVDAILDEVVDRIVDRNAPPIGPEGCPSGVTVDGVPLLCDRPRQHIHQVGDDQQHHAILAKAGEPATSIYWQGVAW